MREIRTYGSVGEREGNNPLYPDTNYRQELDGWKIVHYHCSHGDENILEEKFKYRLLSVPKALGLCKQLV